MMTAEDARSAVRPPLVSLVEHQVEHGALRMDAYGRVAGMIGRSAAWVRRVIGRDERITVGLHDASNIRAAYNRLCTRVEADNARLDAELLATRGEPDAAPAPAARQPAPSRRPRRREDLRFRRIPRPAALIAA